MPDGGTTCSSRWASRWGRMPGASGCRSKPLVRFIWLGALIMGLGGLLAISDRPLPPGRAKGKRVVSEGRKRVRWVLLLPCAVLLVMVYFFGVSLGRDPSLVPSPLVGRPAPEFSLPELLDDNATFSLQDIEEGPWMLNVWASWCAGCLVEHEFLMALGRAGAPLYGLNWKDASLGRHGVA